MEGTIISNSGRPFEQDTPPGDRPNDLTGFVPARDLNTPEKSMEAAHRNGDHAGRYRDAKCHLCYPATGGEVSGPFVHTIGPRLGLPQKWYEPWVGADTRSEREHITDHIEGKHQDRFHHSCPACHGEFNAAEDVGAVTNSFEDAGAGTDSPYRGEDMVGFRQDNPFGDPKWHITWTPDSLKGVSPEWYVQQHQAGLHDHRFQAGCPSCIEEFNAAEVRRQKPLNQERDAVNELQDLWGQINADEMGKVIPKAVQYGAADLDVMGYVLGKILNAPTAREREWSPPELQELAVFFYTMGKVARMAGAYAQGDMPSDDTWHDTSVYARMTQVIRRRGRWM